MGLSTLTGLRLGYTKYHIVVDKSNIHKLVKKRICYVVCYKDPNYIRTLTLLAGLRKNANLEILIVNNKSRSLFRYIEVPIKLLLTRIKYNPSVFIVGFRGDEIFWLLYLSMIGKKKIFDEFVNIHDWFINEHHKFSKDSLSAKILDHYMHWVIGRCNVIMTDTKPHAQLAAEVFMTPIEKFIPIPVATDEAVFYPRPPKTQSDDFEIFFSGNMLPLHGLSIMLDSMKSILQNNQNVHLTLAGGKGKPLMLTKIHDFIEDNNLQKKVNHQAWIEYSKLPDYIARADLCLGGPFGDTGQAGRVISGKTLQFLAMAKPTIVGHNDVHENFLNKQNCLIVKRGNSESLVEAINWAINNRDKLNKIGLAGKKLYRQYYSIEVVATKLQEILSLV